MGIRNWYSLYDRLLHQEALLQAFKKVKSANGAPGIDGQSCKDFATDLKPNILLLLTELRGKTYRPDPVKLVEIAKPGGGIRKIGIPTVRDRVVQQALKNIPEPIFDPDFHPSSYGYRPGRGSHDAIAKATAFMRDYRLKWVVDMDLSKCFDTLDHDLIINSVRERVTDGSILIFKASKAGAINALNTATTFLEKQLKLTVNQKKTHISSLWQGVPYLGVEIFSEFTRIQEVKLREFKRKVKARIKRNSPVNLLKVIKDLNPLLRGFANYFKLANCKAKFKDLMAWIRRRLRSIQMKLGKKPRKLHRRLRQLGYGGEHKHIKMASWRNSKSQHSRWAMPNQWFDELGLYAMDKIKTGELPPIDWG